MTVAGPVLTEEAAAKKRFFRGWYIVAVGFLAHLGYSTSLSSTLGVFFKPMSEEFGWPRSYLSSVRSFETLFAGIIAYFIGPLLDRHGTRTVLVLGGILSAVSLILTAFANDPWQFLFVRGVLLCIGTAAISHLVVSVAISNWFVRLRGRALGISGAGGSTGKIIMAPLVTFLMGIWGWREAWVVLGLLVLVLVPLPAALLIRRRPEDVGLRPDGVGPSDTDKGALSSVARGPSSATGDEAVWTRREAIRTSTFWLIVITFGIANMGTQGLALHMIPYMTDIGFSPAMAAAALSTLSVFQLVGHLSWGFVVERVSLRHFAMAMFLANSCGVAMLALLREPALVVLGLVTFGFSMSGISVLQDIVWANYFGRLSLGAVRGLGMPLLVLLSSGAPLYFGYLYDITGGYDISLLGLAMGLVLSACLVLSCRPPKRRQALPVS